MEKGRNVLSGFVTDLAGERRKLEWTVLHIEQNRNTDSITALYSWVQSDCYTKPDTKRKSKIRLHLGARKKIRAAQGVVQNSSHNKRRSKKPHT